MIDLAMLNLELTVVLHDGLRSTVKRAGDRLGLPYPTVDDLHVSAVCPSEVPSIVGSWTPGRPASAHVALTNWWESRVHVPGWAWLLEGAVIVDIVEWDRLKRPVLALTSGWRVRVDPDEGWSAIPELLWSAIHWQGDAHTSVTPDSAAGQHDLAGRAAIQRAIRPRFTF